MKLWEAMKELEENPNKEFRLKESWKTWTIKTDDYGWYFLLECVGEDSMGGAGEFSGNFSRDDNDWHEVKQPVTWQKAIQAWTEGRKVICKLSPFPDYVYEKKDRNVMDLPEVTLTRGTWYIED